MALIDIPVPQETIAEKVRKIQEKLGQVINLADIRLQEISNLVRTYGRAEISVLLGDDAQALLTVYAKLKEAIEVAKNTSVEELP